MRKLLALIVVLAVGYSGYWYFGAKAVENAMGGWFDDRRGEGWACAVFAAFRTQLPTQSYHRGVAPYPTARLSEWQLRDYVR